MRYAGGVMVQEALLLAPMSSHHLTSRSVAVKLVMHCYDVILGNTCTQCMYLIWCKHFPSIVTYPHNIYVKLLMY